MSTRVAIAAAVLCLSPVVASSEDVPSDLKRDCFWQLAEGTSDRIECTFPAIMTPQERNEVRRLTRNLLQDAHCSVEVSVERALIDEAMTKLSHVFEAPAQPVTCEVHTKKSVFPISSTFAPRVVFKDGAAVEATPGMGKVVGVSPVLGWPVRVWVNRSDLIEDGMLQVINAYLRRRRELAQSDRRVEVQPLDPPQTDGPLDAELIE